MLPFYCIFFFLACLSVCDCVRLKHGQKRGLFMITYVLLALFAGLRAFSPDYSSYSLFFKLLNDPVSAGEDELSVVANDPGFVVINKIIGFFTTEEIVLFCIMAFLSVGINLFCYKKYTPYFFTAILFYFVHTYVAREMMQIRSGLACALCLYSIRFIISGQLKKFLCVVFVAATIHLAAVVFLLSYVLYKIDFSPRVWRWFVVGSLVVAIVMPFGQFLKMLPAIGMLERVQNYSQWEGFEGFTQQLGVFSNPTVLKGLIISFLCLKYYDRLEQSVRGFKVLLNIYLFSVCWLMVWNDFGIVAARIAAFFSIGEVLLVASLFHLFSYHSKYVYVLIICIVAFLMISLNIFTGRFFEYKLVF